MDGWRGERTSPAFRLTLLEAMAGAPVSPARMSVVPRALLFLGRRRGALLASPLCSWSAEVLSSGKGSDMLGSLLCGFVGARRAGDGWRWLLGGLRRCDVRVSQGHSLAGTRTVPERMSPRRRFKGITEIVFEQVESIEGSGVCCMPYAVSRRRRRDDVTRRFRQGR